MAREIQSPPLHPINTRPSKASQAIAGPPPKAKIRWDVLTIFAGTSLISLTLVPWWGFAYGYEPLSILLAVIFLLWNGLSITAGYHRLWSHKSYTAKWPVRLLFALGGALSVQNSIKEWCSGHRRHHQFTDDPQRDPYAATRGFWYSHIGWMIRDYRSGKTNYANIKDLERDALVNWQHKHYAILSLSTNIALPLIFGLTWGDPWGALLLAGFLRLVICHHTTFFINSLAHLWGTQPYSDATTARDNPVIAFFTYGEGYHNYHHRFQWDYRNGIKWYHFDPTKWLIKFLHLSGLAGSLKKVEQAKISISLAEMQLKRAKEGVKRFYAFDAFDEFRHMTRTDVLALLEKEYASLIETIADWSRIRQEWVQIRKDALQEGWEKHEIRRKLREIETRLRAHQRDWSTLTAHFA
ncbi:MAG: fatty acid desaturase [Gammaproteobacteria bacterium]|nr:fatty acid desaturase [Gammaproteobacteria bacterium]